MNILFMGTPEFACDSLNLIHQSKHTISAVVTVPDKPRGRGQKVKFSAVKKLAQKLELKILQPEKLNDLQFIEQLQALNADLFIVVAFRILPESVFLIPSKGSVNLHGSLLPAYRGAAPINRVLMAGENRTGVTTFFLKKKVDTGNMILQREISVPPDKTAGQLHDEMKTIGSRLLLETIELISKGNVVEKIQDDSVASPAPKIFRDDCRIDWSCSAKEIHNQIRALDPFPGAFTSLDTRQVKLFSSRSEIDFNQILDPGKIVPDLDCLFIGTGQGAVCIEEIQIEGRQRMSVPDFLRGHKIDEKIFFE